MRIRAIIGAISIVACSGQTGPSGSLVVSASVPRPSVRLGDTITVSFTIQNVGDAAQDVGFGDCPTPIFQVVAADSQVVGPQRPADEGCLLTLTAKTLAAGEAFTVQTRWDHIGINPAGAASDTLTPGTYFIRANLPGVKLVRNDAASLQVTK